jgi:hypothetical protein
MKKGSQQTLFGAWRVGSEEQRKPIEEAKPLLCAMCKEPFANAGALSVHQSMKHGSNKRTFEEAPVSTTLLEQIRWLQERERDAAHVESVGDDEQEDEMEDVDEEHEGGEPVEKRHGQARRIRRSLKYKFRAVNLLLSTKEELEAIANDTNSPPPTLKDVIAKVQQLGINEPPNNLYRWFKEQGEIARNYAIAKLRKRKTIGSGQHSSIPLAEEAVKTIVLEKRAKNLRVSRSTVKDLLVQKARELEPEAAARVKFGRTLLYNSYRRMNLVVRRISSSKSVQNDIAADYGRFFCRQLMQLRQDGFSTIFHDNSWCIPEKKDSVFGFFPPEVIFACDEVPFNFAADGATVTVPGRDAAVRTLRGTGKRFGTCVVTCSANGDLLKFVLIFKAGQKGLKKQELDNFKKYSNVVVVSSESSYITELLWRNTIISNILFKYIQNKWGRDFCKQRYLFVSDNHSAHQTKNVLKECDVNCIYPIFTPPNYTSHWSLIDDYVGTGARQVVYQKAQDFEQQYFDKNPDGDGGISASERRELVVKWWHEAWNELQCEEKRKLRVNAAKRVGLWVTPTKPADATLLPNPVRFHSTPFQFFGEILYDAEHPDHLKEKRYNFAFMVEKEPVIEEVQAEDEDGHSFEEQCVWKEGEIPEVESSGEEEEDDDEFAQFRDVVIAERRAHRSAQGTAKIVQQYQTLDEVDGRGRKKRK